MKFKPFELCYEGKGEHHSAKQEHLVSQGYDSVPSALATVVRFPYRMFLPIK